MINDADSLNGTFVNNRRIKSQILNDGDIVQFGGLCNLPMGAILFSSDVSVKYKFIIKKEKRF